MSYGFSGRPAPGTTAWAAERIRRLLDLEERDRARGIDLSLIEAASPFMMREYPHGSEEWAAQQIRAIDQRRARELLRHRVVAGAKLPTVAWDAERTSTAPQRSPDRRSGMSNPPFAWLADEPDLPPLQRASYRPPALAGDDPNPALAKTAAPAAVVPWVIGELPAWLPGVATALGLGWLLRGDTKEKSRPDDLCDYRLGNELNRCRRWGKKWWGGCKDRAMTRYVMCLENGGIPDPNEPDEWSEDDMEEWYNPDR